MRLSDWRISKKGLALALIPLIPSFFFLCALRFLLYESELQTQQEKHDREIQATTNVLGANFFQAVSTVSTYLFLHDEALAARYRLLQAKNDEEVKNLLSLVAANGQEKAVAKHFSETDAQAFELLSTLCEAASDGDSKLFLQIQNVKSELESISNQLVADMAEIGRTVAAQNEQRQRLLRADQWKIVLEYAVYIGFVLSAFLAWAVARIFGREITDRLNVIIDNTHRLARKQELSPPQQGNDEIASLDHTFHDMASSLSEAERLKREFVAMLTHDLRNPLTAISLAIGAATSKDINEEAKSSLTNAERDVARLLHMINDLLDLERLDQGSMPLHKEVVVFDTILDRSIESVMPLSQHKNVQINKAVDVECEAFADGERLVRVVVNLLANAIKYCPDGGTIELRCHQSGQNVKVEISDTGPGIPESKRAHLFEKFRQLDDGQERSGSGLGLAICRAIIESHDGQIGVEGREGSGSTFWFSVPSEGE